MPYKKRIYLDALLILSYSAFIVAVVKLIRLHSTLQINWFIVPAILIFAATIPDIIRRRRPSAIVLTAADIKRSLPLLFWTCIVTLPATFCFLMLLKRFGVDFPLRPEIVSGDKLAGWLFYQFFYVAVAEEFFFRGFVQTRVSNLLSAAIPNRTIVRSAIAIIFSSVIFAAAHIVMNENIVSVFTFFPGLVLGFLCLRTGCLAGPILFHGIANTCYLLMTNVLT